MTNSGPETLKAQYAAMLRLRQDAIDRGMYDLAIVYGWSAMQHGVDFLTAAPAQANG